MAGRIIPEGGWASRLKPIRTPRVKTRVHLDFIKSLPCIACMCWLGHATDPRHATGDWLCIDPAHIRAGSLYHGKEPEGGARTADDRWTLPLCRCHHHQQHEGGESEMDFWQRFGVDPHLLALILWGLTGDEYAARRAMQLHADSARFRSAMEGARRAAEA